MLKKIFLAITLILVVFLLLIALVPSSANAEIVYDSDIVLADAATIRNDDNQRLGNQSDVANFNPVYLGASWSTASTYDFARTIMVYDLTYMNPLATITNITLNFYVYDYITSDGMYITETNVSSDPTADDYELSHYTNVIGTLLPTSKPAWYNVTITDYSSFIPGEKVYIGLIMKRDYANLGGQVYNFVNARGPGYADSAYRPSMYIAYQNGTLTVAPVQEQWTNDDIMNFIAHWAILLISLMMALLGYKWHIGFLTVFGFIFYLFAIPYMLTGESLNLVSILGVGLAQIGIIIAWLKN